MDRHLPQLRVCRIWVLASTCFVCHEMADLRFAVNPIIQDSTDGSLSGHVSPLLVDNNPKPGGIGALLECTRRRKRKGVRLFHQHMLASFKRLSDYFLM